MEAMEAVDYPVPAVEAALLGMKERAGALFSATHAVALPESSDGIRLRVASRLLDDYRSVAFKSKVSFPGAPGAPPAGSSAPKLLSDGPLFLLTNGAGQLSSSAASSTSLALTVSGEAGAAGSALSGASFSRSAAAGAAGVSASTASGGAGGAAMAVDAVVASIAARQQPKGVDADSMVEYARAAESTARAQAGSRTALARRVPPKIPTPQWHAPWKLMRVISGHLGWVRSIAVDPSNEWFATGSADRTIKVWELATGKLQVTLTGHINAVRALAISPRLPYLFSAGDDKLVKCWDLETNKCTRQYHGHLSGVYAMALHPTLDLLMTGGRDSVCRVWDIRSKAQVHMLTGHDNTVASIITNSTDPQVVTGSMDNTVRLWDLVAGKVRTVLTHHKKAVRALVSHHREFTFLSGGADSIRKWALPEGVLLSNLSGHNSIVNCMALNQDGVLVSGGDDGSLKFWDYDTGYSFQEAQTQVQPGSLESEAGIYAMAFDRSGSRLLTCEADKTIKVYRQDEDASEETHPVDMRGWTEYCRAHKMY